MSPYVSPRCQSIRFLRFASFDFESDLLRPDLTGLQGWLLDLVPHLNPWARLTIIINLMVPFTGDSASLASILSFLFGHPHFGSSRFMIHIRTFESDAVPEDVAAAMSGLMTFDSEIQLDTQYDEPDPVDLCCRWLQAGVPFELLRLSGDNHIGLYGDRGPGYATAMWSVTERVTLRRWPLLDGTGGAPRLSVLHLDELSGTECAKLMQTLVAPHLRCVNVKLPFADLNDFLGAPSNRCQVVGGYPGCPRISLLSVNLGLFATLPPDVLNEIGQKYATWRVQSTQRGVEGMVCLTSELRLLSQTLQYPSLSAFRNDLVRVKVKYDSRIHTLATFSKQPLSYDLLRVFWVDFRSFVTAAGTELDALMLTASEQLRRISAPQMVEIRLVVFFVPKPLMEKICRLVSEAIPVLRQNAISLRRIDLFGILQTMSAEEARQLTVDLRTRLWHKGIRLSLGSDADGMSVKYDEEEEDDDETRHPILLLNKGLKAQPTSDDFPVEHLPEKLHARL